MATKTEKINQKLKELKKEKAQTLSNIHKPRTRPKPSSITKTETLVSLSFLTVVVLCAFWCGIFPNYNGLMVCFWLTCTFVFIFLFGIVFRTKKRLSF